MPARKFSLDAWVKVSNRLPKTDFFTQDMEGRKGQVIGYKDGIYTVSFSELWEFRAHELDGIKNPPAPEVYPRMVGP